MPTGSVRFQLADLKKLLVHYTEGEIPMEAEAINFGRSPVISGWWAIICKMDKPLEGVNEITPGVYMYHFRYEGDRTLQFKGKDQEAVYDLEKDAWKT